MRLLPWLGVSAHVSCVMNSIILEHEREREGISESMSLLWTVGTMPLQELCSVGIVLLYYLVRNNILLIFSLRV